MFVPANSRFDAINLENGREQLRLHVANLEGKIYSCRHCQTHLALRDDIVSRSFQSRHGKAYLFCKVVNIWFGQKEDRMMITGMHNVADIFCVCCGSIVGWKYEVAYDKGQRYKEGNFILERFKVSGPDGHLEGQAGDSDAEDSGVPLD